MEEVNVDLVVSDSSEDASDGATQSAAGGQVGQICWYRILLKFWDVRHIPLPHLLCGLSQERWISTTGLSVVILSLSLRSPALETNGLICPTAFLPCSNPIFWITSFCCRH